MTKPLHIVADREIPYLQGVLEPYARVDYLPGSSIGPEDLAAADVLLTRTRTCCDAALLADSPVGLIATATIGHDHIDLEYCRRRGIEVVSAAGCNAFAVLQYVMGALGALARRDGWRPCEKRLGIVGVGHVGSLVYRYGERFGFRVLGCDPPRLREDPGLPFTSLDQMLPECDIVTLHVPLGSGEDATAGMAGGEFFARLKPGAIFINTARGPVVEDAALLEALRGGVVSRAVVDTWNHEPRPDSALLEAVACATPHIAGYSRQGKAAGTAAVVRAVARRFDLPLTDWYPPGVEPSCRDERLSWEEMCRRMPDYFDIEARSAELKANPEAFERLRDGYVLRDEFF